MRNKNFLEAECICEKYDARLCTKLELESNCGIRTGCGTDRQLVWTSTEKDLPVDEQCASETDGDSTTVKYWAMCGRKNKCPNEPNGVFDYDVPHEVSCCSDTSKPGWKKRRNCNVWAQSKFDGKCMRNKNFLEAECICEKYGARLCTKQEANRSCARGTGCGNDRRLVWTSVSFECCIERNRLKWIAHNLSCL